MSGFAFLMILGAVFSHAAWNLFVKSSSDRLAAMVTVLSSVGLVGLVMIPFVPLPDSSGIWRLIVISALLHYAYNLSLLFAYRFADLSLAYPIARGSVPILVLVLAYWSLQELPPVMGILGVICVGFGLILLSFSARHVDPRGLGFAFLTGFWIASYTVVDGMGVRESANPWSFIAWNFATHLTIPVVVWGSIWRRRIPTGFWRLSPLGFLSPLAYGLVLWAKITTDLAAVSALRETSVLVVALLGAFILGEGQARLRLFAAAFVCLGAILVVMA